jgi:hypothetical protein
MKDSFIFHLAIKQEPTVYKMYCHLYRAHDDSHSKTHCQQIKSDFIHTLGGFLRLAGKHEWGVCVCVCAVFFFGQDQLIIDYRANDLKQHLEPQPL